MKQDIKHKELRERQTYVPASVEVITISEQRVICTSQATLDEYPGNSWD